MKIRNIKKEEYKELYSHMKRDFPANELAPFFAVKRNLHKNIYEGYYLTDNTDIIDMGYAVITAPENLQYALINYFGIFPEYRSQGYGSEFLKILFSHYSDRILVLEADAPLAAKTDALRNEAERRVKFYERAGFRVIPTEKAKIFGVDMVIMASSPDENENEKLSAREIMHALYLPSLAKQWLRFIDIVDAADSKN
jgi:GNAT superfamily N-acetyltransferase